MSNIIKKYPELDSIAELIANHTCKLINSSVENIKSENPYQAQYVLEEVIEILQGRV